MALIFTPVYSNTLTGANQNPLDPTNIGNGGFANIRIQTATGRGTSTSNYNEAYYIGSPALSNDQYVSVEIAHWTSAVDNELNLGIRDVNGSGSSSYELSVTDNDDGTVWTEIDVTDGSGNILNTLYQNQADVLPVANDVFTLFAIGSTIGLIKNGSTVYQGTDSTYTAGSALLSVLAAPTSALTVNNLVYGNVTSPSSGGTSRTEFAAKSIPGQLSNDYIQLVNSSGIVIGWIDPSGRPGGTLGNTGNSTPRQFTQWKIPGNPSKDFVHFVDTKGDVIGFIDTTGAYKTSGLPVQASEKIFSGSSTLDFLQIKDSLGNVIGWIDSTGALNGTL
jgi:hypothetical protein